MNRTMVSGKILAFWNRRHFKPKRIRKIRKYHFGHYTYAYIILYHVANSVMTYESHICHLKGEKVALRVLLSNDYIQRVKTINPSTKREIFCYTITVAGYKKYIDLIKS